MACIELRLMRSDGAIGTLTPAFSGLPSRLVILSGNAGPRAFVKQNLRHECERLPANAATAMPGEPEEHRFERFNVQVHSMAAGRGRGGRLMHGVHWEVRQFLDGLVRDCQTGSWVHGYGVGFRVVDSGVLPLS
jgi:hypothetical protein